MTDKEKEFLQDWIFNSWGKSEVEFSEKLYSFSKYDYDMSLSELIAAYYKKKFYSNFLSDLNEVLRLEFFDDTTKYKNRSAEFLNRLTLSQSEDDLVYSFVLGIIHKDKFEL